MQKLENRFNDFYNKIIDWFSELGLDDFLNKLNDMHRIIKLFDGNRDNDYFPKFNKMHDTIIDLNKNFDDFKKDCIDRLKSLNNFLEKLSEDINDGFLMVAEIFKTLNDFVTNIKTHIKPKIININKKINSLTDAAKNLKDTLDKILLKIKQIKIIKKKIADNHALLKKIHNPVDVILKKEKILLKILVITLNQK